MKKLILPITMILLILLSGCATAPSSERFYEALRQGDVSTVDELIKGGFVDTHKGGHLVDAVEFNRMKIVELLLNSGYPVNEPGGFGRYALHEAVKRGRVDMVKLLLDRGANPNIIDKCGELPLGNAAVGAAVKEPGSGFYGTKENYTEITELLKAKGASYKVRAEYDRTPLINSTLNNCLYATEAIIKYYEYDINATDSDGNTAYHFASGSSPNSLEAAELLRKKGANPNVRNNRGYTPAEFWEVIKHGEHETMQIRDAQRAKEKAEREKMQAEQDARNNAPRQPTIWEINAEKSREALRDAQSHDDARRNADYRRDNNCSGSSCNNR